MPKRGKRARSGAPPDTDPGLQPRPIGGMTFGGEIQFGGGPTGGPGTGPTNLSYPGSPASFSMGAQVPPLEPTLDGEADRWFITPPLPNASIPALPLNPESRGGVLMPTNLSPIAYKPVEYTLPAGFALLDVYLPAGLPPTDGWPVLLTTRVAGWFGAPVRGLIDPTDPFAVLLHKAINAGIAVLDVGSNGSGVPGNPVFPAWFYPPGHSSGRWENENQTLPDKDMVHAVQWTKEQTTFPLDGERIYLMGLSAGAQIGLWIAFHPDLAATAGSSQIQRETSVAGVVALNPITSFVAQQDDWPVANPRFESVSNPGQDASDLADADPEIRDQASPLRSLLEQTSRTSLVPCFIACDEPLEVADFTLEADEHPALRNALGDPNIHDLWNSAMLAAQLRLVEPTLHAAKSALWIRPGYSASLGTLQGLVTGTFSGTLADGAGTEDLWNNLVAWLVARAGEARAVHHGLQLNPRAGVIHGIPNVAQPSTMHAILATGGDGTTNTTLSIEVTTSSSA